MKKLSSLLLPIMIAGVIGLVSGIIISRHQSQTPLLNQFINQEKKHENQYLAFLHEVRDTITKNYWSNITEHQLVNLHLLAIEKLIAQPLGATIQTYETLDNKILELLNEYPDDEVRHEFTIQLADLVLANLEPFGRSRLYSQQLEQELIEKVSNIDPEADHYKALELDPDASPEKITQAYEEQKQKLVNDDSPEAQEKLAQIETAHHTLADEATRSRYDEAGVNPTMEWRLLNNQVFYLKIKQFSPSTVQELAEVSERVDDQGPELDTLILDLRGNIGGAVDGLPYFLGPFIGNNQYAYQLIQQDKVTDFKTRTGWLPSLVRYKKVIVLIDDQVQSTGEVMASVLKKYNVGVLVGTPTQGWGTIEKVFPLKNQLTDQEQYSVFLVHHLTLREDGLPIEGNGVEPMVNVQDANWQDQLKKYFNDAELVSVVAQQFTIKQ